MVQDLTPSLIFILLKKIENINMIQIIIQTDLKTEVQHLDPQPIRQFVGASGPQAPLVYVQLMATQFWSSTRRTKLSLESN